MCHTSPPQTLYATVSLQVRVVVIRSTSSVRSNYNVYQRQPDMGPFSRGRFTRAAGLDDDLQETYALCRSWLPTTNYCYCNTTSQASQFRHTPFGCLADTGMMISCTQYLRIELVILATRSRPGSADPVFVYLYLPRMRPHSVAPRVVADTACPFSAFPN